MEPEELHGEADEAVEHQEEVEHLSVVLQPLAHDQEEDEQRQVQQALVDLGGVDGRGRDAHAGVDARIGREGHRPGQARGLPVAAAVEKAADARHRQPQGERKPRGVRDYREGQAFPADDRDHRRAAQQQAPEEHQAGHVPETQDVHPVAPELVQVAQDVEDAGAHDASHQRRDDDVEDHVGVDEVLLQVAVGDQQAQDEGDAQHEPVGMYLERPDAEQLTMHFRRFLPRTFHHRTTAGR